MSKLKFRVVHSSSEDSGYPSSELNAHSPSTRGWQSDKFCQFPQELGFELVRGESKLSQVQILSHQSKIATKVEIFLGQGHDYHSANFKRLGYLSLDNNERSSYQARELKTVYIDQSGRFIKLLIHKNYVNKQNMFSQVGIVALNLLGSDEERGHSPGGSSGMSHSDRGNQKTVLNNPLNDLSIDMNLDPPTAEKLRLLSDAKAKAVATEDYVTAKKIKVVEGELKSLGTQLAQLDMAKRLAVADEDYDKAKEIKDEVDSLRAEIEQKILAVRIPGVTDKQQFQTNRSRPPSHQFSPESHNTPNDYNDNQDKDYSESKSEMRPIPLNIDDLPVGKGNTVADGSLSGRGGYVDDSNADSRFSSSGSGRKRSPRGVQPLERVEGVDSDISSAEPHGQDSDVHYGAEENSSPQNNLVKSRKLKPKETESYNDRDPFMGGSDPQNPQRDDDDGNENHFPPGEHPLDGVPHLNELAAPEALKGKSRELSEQTGITNLIGEYRARCLFSKVWTLRDAAITKVQMMLQDEFESQPGVLSCLAVLSAIVRVSVEDKIQQVLFTAISFMDAILAATRRAKLPRSTVAPLMDPVVAILIEKLSDGNARIREGARKGLEVLAASSNIGSAVVASHGIKPLPSKQASAWRPISTRLQLLTDLVATYGIGGGSGLATEGVMNFAKAAGAFAHSNAEVRDSAKELTVAVHAVVGTGAIDSYLRALRPKQLEEYHAAFEGNPTAQKKTNDSNNNGNYSDHKGSDTKNPLHNPSAPSPAGGGGGGGKVNTSAVKASANNVEAVDEGDETPDFTICMFCGEADSKWNEDALDLHYWKDCALLAPCPACAQVVEVAGLPEHLLDECDQKALFVPCDVTGLAIRENEMAAWEQSSKCSPAPANCMYCPLCLDSVEDTNDAWKEHLIYGCSENKRGSSHK